MRYDGETGDFISTFARGSGLNDPGGVVFGPDSNLYVSSFRAAAVLRYDGETGEFIDRFARGGGRGEIEEACAPYGYQPQSLRLLARLIVRDLRQPGDIAAA